MTHQPRPSPPPSIGAPTLAGVALAWAFMMWLLTTHGWRLLPLPLARRLTEGGFLGLGQLLATAFGVVLWGVVVSAPRKTLALLPRARRAWLAAALLGPVLFIAQSHLLRLATRLGAPSGDGALAALSDPGAEAATAGGLLAFVIVTPLAQELLFRGALWRALERALTRSGAPASPAVGVLLALAAAAASTAGHWVLTRGAAVGWATLTVLGVGVALGLVRWWGGGVLPAVVASAGHRLCLLSVVQRWWPAPGDAPVHEAPRGLALLALGCLLALGALGWASRRLSLARSADASTRRDPPDHDTPTAHEPPDAR